MWRHTHTQDVVETWLWRLASHTHTSYVSVTSRHTHTQDVVETWLWRPMSLLREGTHVSVTWRHTCLCYETHIELCLGSLLRDSHMCACLTSSYVSLVMLRDSHRDDETHIETHLDVRWLTSRLTSHRDDSHRDVRHRNMTRLTSRCERWRDSHRDVRHTSSYVSVTSKHTHTQDVETWGTGVETQKNTKNLVPLFEKDKNKKSHQRRRLLQHYWYKVPVLHIVKTIWGASRNGNLLVQIEPKNGFESEKVIMGIDS